MTPFCRRVFGILLGSAFVMGAAPFAVSAQINTDIIEQNREALEKQGSNADMKRPSGTLPQDWAYQLPAGVTTRQITFYVDGGTPLYGKLFFPRGFTKTGKWPAVVVGHGINAISIGIEKFAARFADRGLVAMAIDYVSYGYSGGEVSLLEPDTTTDDRAVWGKTARIQMKRTDLNNFHEIDDYRAAVSYLVGEPGVDRDRIGIWGTSNAGSVVISVAAQDARVKAVVSQVMGTGAAPARGPVPMRPDVVDDAILRARTGQGVEIDGGFSFRTKIDRFAYQIIAEVRPGSTIDRIPDTTKLLSVLAEHDELAPPAGAPAAAKAFKGTWQVVTLPAMTHFQMYSNTAFEVDSTLAGDWFVKYLGTGH